MFSAAYEKRLLESMRPEHAATAAAATTMQSTTMLDRFIPSRRNNNWQRTFVPAAHTKGNTAFACILQNELFETEIESMKNVGALPGKVVNESFMKIRPKLYNFQEPQTSSVEAGTKKFVMVNKHEKTQGTAYFTLRAPFFDNRFSLNLVDWTGKNAVSFGCSDELFYWNLNTNQMLVTVHIFDEANEITSMKSNKCGDLLAIGTQTGAIILWDTETQKNIHNFVAHASQSKRVCALSLHEAQLASGSSNHHITVYDIRQKLATVCNHRAHVNGVYGLKWSPNAYYLASGGNDHLLKIWEMRQRRIWHTFEKHTAAVKAIDWSPHQPNLLLSGGGSGDYTICVWDIMQKQLINHVNTKSQVCNVHWAKNSTNQFVSTHGSPTSTIYRWNYPTMTKNATLYGHLDRVLYSSLSPDGDKMVTGSPDGTVRLWNVFPHKTTKTTNKSVLQLYAGIR